MPGKRILVVDDEPLLRNATSRRLERMGFEVFQASDAKEAIKIIADKALDLVITDNDMPPGRCGVELAAIIKEVEPTLPVFIFTGLLSGLGPHNADAVFEKPADLAKIFTAVLELLGNPR